MSRLILVGSVIDARKHFNAQDKRYVVNIKVVICPAFIWAVIKAMFSRQDMKITHTFDVYPFIEPEE